MGRNTTAVQMTSQADTVPDALMEVIRNGAWALLAKAVQAELEGLLQPQRGRRDAKGRRAVVRNGYLPEYRVQICRVAMNQVNPGVALTRQSRCR